MFDDAKILTLKSGLAMIGMLVKSKRKFVICMDGLPGSGRTYFVHRLLKTISTNDVTIIDDGKIFVDSTGKYVLLDSKSWNRLGASLEGELNKDEIAVLGFRADKIICSVFCSSYFFREIDYYIVICCSKDTRLRRLLGRGESHLGTYSHFDKLNIAPDTRIKNKIIILNEEIIPNYYIGKRGGIENGNSINLPR